MKINSKEKGKIIDFNNKIFERFSDFFHEIIDNPLSIDDFIQGKVEQKQQEIGSYLREKSADIKKVLMTDDLNKSYHSFCKSLLDVNDKYFFRTLSLCLLNITSKLLGLFFNKIFVTISVCLYLGNNDKIKSIYKNFDYYLQTAEGKNLDDSSAISNFFGKIPLIKVIEEKNRERKLTKIEENFMKSLERYNFVETLIEVIAKILIAYIEIKYSFITLSLCYASSLVRELKSESCGEVNNVKIERK